MQEKITNYRAADVRRALVLEVRETTEAWNALTPAEQETARRVCEVNARLEGGVGCTICRKIMAEDPEIEDAKSRQHLIACCDPSDQFNLKILEGGAAEKMLEKEKPDA